MHRLHNIYMFQIQQNNCNKYMEEFLRAQLQNNIKELNILNEKINKCHNSFSNKAICSSVNSCGVTLK